MLPLTGVPLPFISYGNSNLIVLLAGMGLLINVAAGSGAAAGAARPAQLVRARRSGAAETAAVEGAARRRGAGRCQRS